MHTEIFNNIDLLVEMAGSSLNVDDINAELITINKEINDKTQAIEDLKSIMNDARYFNASNELIDKNIEISLKSKINRLKRKIKDINSELNLIKEEESKLHNEVNKLKGQITHNEKYLTVLKKKSESSSSNNYKQIVLTEEDNLNRLKEELLKKEQKHKTVLKELELNSQALKELTQNKEQEEEKLKAITDSLNNPNSYIDEDLKKDDEAKLISLNEALEKAEKRKLELLTDPNMIGTDAKELIIKNNNAEALSKIKELVTIVKGKPFMDIENASILDEVLEKAEKERAELATLLETKDYKGLNNDVLSKRTNYINEQITKINNIISEYQTIIKEADEDIDNNISVLIKDIEASITKIAGEIEEYETLLKDKSKSNKTRANLENTLQKKTKEKEIMEDLLQNYQNDLLTKISLTNALNKEIENFNQNITEYKEELKEISNIASLELNAKDFLEEEQDKDKLKAKNDEIKQIKNRKKYTKTPNEIYDQIEMSLATSTPSKTRSSKTEQADILIDNLYEEENEPPKNSKEPQLKVVKMIPVQTIKAKDKEGDVYGA